ncbi:hybrid sensor histidine kinase/response regulator [Janthinobacterium sp. BJB1]|uniref:hybrid sensor histidine kinase/response regulator n=1 Tax=Janthinobacterium sp. GW458P TaxID=1981504 RepID=UPI000A326E13|nr:PAS domain S-box protein [Janthinobacterium sp. GW458P]MBE3023207.1 PAS domain S-box protein [Janthinobacterium sp. GW458P]PHV16211.1 hybrid sensor histidine kinase/response regulator [Janthinobacterium sp. BJB303]PJC98535.1 hybrid sensor histidine kinase/response regulator [Janthinobacterium sp. BJB1]
MSKPTWPRGGGSMGELVRQFDWSASSLGALDAWPAHLRTSVDIVLHSPMAMVLMWGPQHVMVYNDEYINIAGPRHPAALGGTVPAVWPEIWDWNARILEAGLRGETQVHRERCLPLLRDGQPTDVCFDLFYTPVHGADGQVDGVLCTAVELTARMEEGRQLKLATAELGKLNATLQAESEAVRAANRRLDEDRALLRALFQQAPSFMALLRGPQHVFELANEHYLRLVGRDDLLGQPVEVALPEVKAQGFIDLLDQVYRSGVAYEGRQVRVDLQTADGQTGERHVDFVYQPIKDADGAVTGILVEGIDVTERMEGEERLRLAQQAGGIGTFEWFPETGAMLVSPTFRRQWGIADDEEVTQQLLVSLVDARDQQKVGPSKLELAPNPLEYVEYRIRRPADGAVRWIARQGEVIAGRLPGQRRYVGVSFDVTERRQIEEELMASQERMAAIFGQASVGLSELGLDGRFQRVNGALCCMLGRSAEELLSLNMNDILHPDDVPGNNVLFRRLVETGESFSLEKRYLKPDGSQVWVSSNVSRLVDEQGHTRSLIAVKTDITDRRRVEKALHELNETLEHRVEQEVSERTKAEDALRQAQKMEAVGQLTGGIAHDFNNVLQIISGNLHLLQHLAGTDGLMRQRLDTAIAAVERGAKLSSHLLAFARRQPLKPVVADLARVVRNMDALLRRALGEAIDIVLVGGGGLWNTLVDRSQIENVILNLAINARDAMDGAGKLTIELGNVVLDEHYVHNLVDVPAGQYVMLSVTDTGRGMSGPVLQRAFEPFFTTKPEGAGTGLGLSMAYGFVTQSRGHIRIYSEPGVGTGVKIYLPRSLMAEADEEVELSGVVTGGTETVLVVEDDVGVRTTVVDMLGALGYTVLKAEDGESALAVLHSGAQIDLLFTDVIMPGPVSSTDMARQARELQPDIAVLFTSGYAQDVIVHEGRLDAGVELLSKPYRREELARKLRHVLANRQQQMRARQFERSGAPVSGGLAASALGAGTPGLDLTGHAPAPQGDMPTSMKILVVEDNLDSQLMVCELVGMLGHTVSGVSDGESAWQLLSEQDFDILFTDVSLPGMSGIALARMVLREKPDMRIIFSTGYGKESMDELGFSASVLRKPYDLMELQAALDQS